jgi:hypothetical protein
MLLSCYNNPIEIPHCTRLVQQWGFFMHNILLTTAILCGILADCEPLDAHPMPNSALLLDIHAERVSAELRLPLVELSLAFGQQLSATAVQRFTPELTAYLLRHISAKASNGQAWSVSVERLWIDSSQTAVNGQFLELCASIALKPPPAGSPSVSPRDMVLEYSVILHQVVTHTALVLVRQDWEAGLIDGQPLEIGIIAWDIRSNTLPPFVLNRSTGTSSGGCGGGGVWRGFERMVRLGMRHIAEGTDHVLFVLALLLPAPLLAKNKRWCGFGGIRYAVQRVFVVVTAFTVGHSLTLLVGAIGWVQLPQQPVEIVIALSIVISAIHAVVPLFDRKEAAVAVSFGLVHGLAFAGVIVSLHLDARQTALSIVGFNAGIELMQMGIVLITIPWLMLWSQTRWYTAMRVASAGIIGFVALAWMAERVFGKPNVITLAIERITPLTPVELMLMLVGVAALSLFVFWLDKRMKYMGLR